MVREGLPPERNNLIAKVYNTVMEECRVTPEEEGATEGSIVPSLDVERLLLHLQSAVTTERMQAARDFSEIIEPRSTPFLVALLTDPCPLVRISAAYGVGRNPSPEAVLPLIACLDDFNDYVRKGVVWALGNCRDRQALEPLSHALRYDIEAVRLWSASALGQLGEPLAIPILSEHLLHDPEAAVRANCAWALGQLGDETAILALQKGLQDQDLGVQQDCRDALEQLGYLVENWGIKVGYE